MFSVRFVRARVRVSLLLFCHAVATTFVAGFAPFSHGSVLHCASPAAVASPRVVGKVKRNEKKKKNLKIHNSTREGVEKSKLARRTQAAAAAAAVRNNDDHIKRRRCSACRRTRISHLPRKHSSHPAPTTPCQHSAGTRAFRTPSSFPRATHRTAIRTAHVHERRRKT